ncbi:hypothetical protein M8C13_39865 [Crossiella sp. SN42]|uniref:allene oxide cyclase barrel-like domain-containing protein n=1 Tax=Crossiella sp. SN42 TaxID=2944808 RepID=UPI00207C5C20|nr:hypothetical protein [Crossiella sp. SN42]MCO1581924.1 hypothetical protein [Crossiella sp. SN42]
MSIADPVPGFAGAVSTVITPAETESLVLLDLTEDVDLRYHAVNPPGPGLGDHNTYDSVVTDAEGTAVCTIAGAGWKVLERSSDGHLMAYYQETITFPDGGEVRTSGWIDVQAILEGRWQSLYAVGTRGSLMGLVGTRELRGEIPRKRFRANLRLSRQG